MSAQAPLTGSGRGKAFFAGFFACLGFLALLAGTLLPVVPNSTPISPIARLFDSLSPWFLGLTLGAGMAVWGCGRRWIAALLMISAVLGAWHLWGNHRANSLPLAPHLSPDIRVVFFNAYDGNEAFADRVVTSLLEVDPDIVVIAEGDGLYPALPRLMRNYAFVTPCEYEKCELIIAAKRQPLRNWFLSLNVAWPNRYGVAEFVTEDGKPYFLAASHSVKPWLSGIAESEQIRLAAQYDWLSGPVVAVGDFNAAPWGYSMRNVLKLSDMKALRWPIATWPAAAGRFGVPIDHVLVKGGVRIVDAQPFGRDLNSNHLGLIIDAALP